ncbi:siphovirus Gp157 family protein [Ectobacillus antri]|uniref:siphovirus Gp157 family protein n=1 Tax=Ectobacillus antri TaxID=2486280 RepID=UPI000F59EBA2|nr:siphovirus Gp157 family protein [Ectobacillus antri]
MKLYELTNQYRQLVDMVDELDQQTLADTLESISDLIEDKAENIAFVIRTLEAEAKVIKEEEERLQALRKAREARVSNLKDYLLHQLETAGISKIKRPKVMISITNNPASVRVLDETMIPDIYKIPQAPKLDKKAVLAELKNGGFVIGAELQQGKGVRIK